MNFADEQLAVSTVDSVDLSMELAGVGARAYAFSIDWSIRALGAAFWLLLAAGIRGMPGVELGAIGFFAPAAVIYLGYHPVLELLRRGVSPGKRIAGLIVVRNDGGAPGPGAIVLRNLFRLIDSLPVCYALGLVLMFATRRQTRLGDIVSGSLVVYASRQRLRMSDTVLADEGLPPRTALLIEEVLQRWDELVPDARAALGSKLLSQIGLPVPADAAAIREHLQTALRTGAA